MNMQPALIHTQQTWMHFIGGYYANTDRFVNEAIKSRISRRAAAQQVRGMQFGDRLVLLRYQRKGEIMAFGEAQITGITLDHEIAKEVGERLEADGLAEYNEPSGGGSMVTRECGSYMLIGFWSVKCELSGVMDIASEIAKEKGETLFVMVNAELTQIYESPTYLQPAPKFTRGFIKPADQSSYSVTPIAMVVDPCVYAVRDYQKAPRLKATN